MIYPAELIQNQFKLRHVCLRHEEYAFNYRDSCFVFFQILILTIITIYQGCLTSSSSSSASTLFINIAFFDPIFILVLGIRYCIRRPASNIRMPRCCKDSEHLAQVNYIHSRCLPVTVSSTFSYFPPTPGVSSTSISTVKVSTSFPMPRFHYTRHYQILASHSKITPSCDLHIFALPEDRSSIFRALRQ